MNCQHAAATTSRGGAPCLSAAGPRLAREKGIGLTGRGRWTRGRVGPNRCDAACGGRQMICTDRISAAGCSAQGSRGGLWRRCSPLVGGPRSRHFCMGSALGVTRGIKQERVASGRLWAFGHDLVIRCRRLLRPTPFSPATSGWRRASCCMFCAACSRSPCCCRKPLR